MYQQLKASKFILLTFLSKVLLIDHNVKLDLIY